MGFGAEADRCGERLACEHMRAVELAVDHTVEQHFPVGLGFERHEQAFVEEVALLVGNREGGHVGELNEAEGQLVFLELERLSMRGCGKRG